MIELSDIEIVRRIKTGEIECFSFVVKKYGRLIEKYVRNKIYNQADADDIIQETFFKFYRAIDRFDERRPFSPYLYEIAKNEMKMYFRAHQSTVSLPETITEEDKYFNKINVKEVLTALEGDQRKALQMIGDGYSYEEIARKLKRPLNTVRTIIRRGRLKLRKAI